MSSFWRNYKPLSNWENDKSIHAHTTSNSMSLSTDQLFSISIQADNYFHCGSKDIQNDNVRLKFRLRQKNQTPTFSIVPSNSKVTNSYLKNSNSDLSKVINFQNLIISQQYSEALRSYALKPYSSDSSSNCFFTLITSHVISIMSLMPKYKSEINLDQEIARIIIPQNLIFMEKMFIYPGNLAYFNHILEDISSYGEEIGISFLRISKKSDSDFNYPLPNLSLQYSLKKNHLISTSNGADQLNKIPTPQLEPEFRCKPILSSISKPNNEFQDPFLILNTDPTKKVQELIAEGYYEAAIKKATDSLSKQSKPSMYVHRAIALKKCNRIIEAIADCSEVIKLSKELKAPQKDPTLIKALKLRASFWLEIGEIHSAIKDLSLVVGSDLLKEIMSQTGIRNFDQETHESQLKLLMNALKKSQQKSK